MSGTRQPASEAEGISPREPEPRLVSVAVDVVRIDGIKALAGACPHPRPQDRGEDVKTADVQPALPRPAFQRSAHHTLGEAFAVGAEVLVAPGVHVADDVTAVAVQCADSRRRGLVTVNVKDPSWVGEIDLALQLKMPWPVGGLAQLWNRPSVNRRSDHRQGEGRGNQRSRSERGPKAHAAPTGCAGGRSCRRGACGRRSRASTLIAGTNPSSRERAATSSAAIASGSV